MWIISVCIGVWKSPDPKSFIGIMFLSLSCFPPGGVYKTIMISYSKMHAYTHEHNSIAKIKQLCQLCHTSVDEWKGAAVLIATIGTGVGGRVHVHHKVGFLPAIFLQRAPQLLKSPHNLQHQASATYLPIGTVTVGQARCQTFSNTLKLLSLTRITTLPNIHCKENKEALNRNQLEHNQPRNQ